MIIYLATSGNLKPIERYLETWGKPVSELVVVLSYDQLFQRKSVWSGTYVFTDLERLSPRKAESASQVRNQLAQSDKNIRLLNHPTGSRRRYALLRQLYERGINHFNVYLLTESRLPERYPVFIRRENDHKGSITGLINSFEELCEEIANMDRLGLSHEDAVITEFCDTADKEGLYRKYSAFIVGEKIIPRHVFFRRNWIVKSYDLMEEQMLQEEWEYVSSNPHQAEIKEIFDLARIQYGRIDYSILNGRIQVWEINTNPTIGSYIATGGTRRHRINERFANNFNNAIRCINLPSSNNNPVKLLVSNHKQTDSAKKWAKILLHNCLRTCRLLEYEERFLKLLKFPKIFKEKMRSPRR